MRRPTVIRAKIVIKQRLKQYVSFEKRCKLRQWVSQFSLNLVTFYKPTFKHMIYLIVSHMSWPNAKHTVHQVFNLFVVSIGLYGF